MRQNSKHLDQNEVAAMPVQTDGQTGAGCTDDKAKVVMNKFMSIFLHLYLLKKNSLFYLLHFQRPGFIQVSVTYNTEPPLSAKRSAALRKGIRPESRCVMKPKPSNFSSKISLQSKAKIFFSLPG